MTPKVIAPLISAFIYAFAALALKRATGGGVGPWRVSFVTNWTQAAIFSLLLLTPGEPFSWVHASHAALAGAAFFVGQVFTFLALSKGDVSVATPVLGTKVVFVAIFTVLLLGEKIPATWWLAAFITCVATALLGGGRPSVPGNHSFRRSLFYGFSAACAFALTDILAQHWAREWGFSRFAPVLFLTVAVLSLGLIPFFNAPLTALPANAWGWLLTGAVLLTAQAAGIAYAIMSFGDATLVNILYTSRGVWTIAIVWGVGHWFGNTESTQGRRVMLQRLAGAGLIILSVKLAIR